MRSTSNALTGTKAANAFKPNDKERALSKEVNVSLVGAASRAKSSDTVLHQTAVAAGANEAASNEQATSEASALEASEGVCFLCISM